MTNQPLVSIIIPSFNRADIIGDTLDSIKIQTYTNWECIVIDDGSTDHTEQVLENYIEKDKRFKFYHRPDYLVKSGNSCRNYGFEKSKGELVTFFDSDDVMLEDFLSSRIELFTQKIEIVFATYTIVDENLNFLRENEFKVEDTLIKEYMFWKFPILTPSSLIKREYLENKTLFDPSIKRGQETDFYLNILPELNNEQFTFVDKPTFLYRLHDKTITNKAQSYTPDYMPSLIHVRSKALKVGLEIQHKELVYNSYEHLILILFKIIKNKDFKNLNVFINYLNKIKLLNFTQKLEIKCLSRVLVLIGLTPKILEYRWIKFLSK
ncbi:glycosyltransferase family 2 protein [Empedobacter brevis]|uniref:glycosyltransferase family 2 protein n=1 Tax=Empedobacter brevis TaxID=247 RepID=UPI0023EF95E1|nr:glycosyltransferase family 2 protein [Empedobacter brevis]